jgi:hypothetical protein
MRPDFPPFRAWHGSGLRRDMHSRALSFVFPLLAAIGCSSSVATSADDVDGGTDATGDSIVGETGGTCAGETTPVEGGACTHSGVRGCEGPTTCALCYVNTWAKHPTTCDCVDGRWKCGTVAIYDCFGPGPGTYSDPACKYPSVVTDGGGDGPVDTADVGDARETGDASDTGGVKCGTTTCDGAGEYCVRPCCGGADTGTPCSPPPPFCTVTSCVPGTACHGVCPSGGTGYLDATKKEIACLCG